MLNTLLLGSKSKSRQYLLQDAGINFSLVEQEAIETSFEWKHPFENLVKDIAIFKMDHVILPSGTKEGDYCFVLTADTLGLDNQGNIYGKPVDKEDAIKKIKSYRNGSLTGTAFCLDKKIWKNGKWDTDQRIVEFVSTEYIFYIPDDWIEKYFELSIAAGINYMQVSGAVAVEKFGAQFLKHINGSYTTIVGLPMFELREALSKMGFFLNL